MECTHGTKVTLPSRCPHLAHRLRKFSVDFRVTRRYRGSIRLIIGCLPPRWESRCSPSRRPPHSGGSEQREWGSENLSVHWISWVWKHGPKDPELRFTMLTLADRADEQGVCWPKVAEIAERVCCSERAVQYRLSRLEEGGWLLRDRQGGRGNSAMYTLMDPSINGATDCTDSKTERVLSTSPIERQKGATQRRKRVQPSAIKGATCDNPPYNPPSRRTVSNRQGEPCAQSALPLSAGAEGEFMAATWLGEELSLAWSRSDLPLIANVIRLEAKGRGEDTQAAVQFLRTSALEARKRGESVTVFWFKDRKFANGGSNGNGSTHESAAKQRLDGNRRALAEAAIKRGWYSPNGHAGESAAALAEPGHGGIDGGISGGLRAAGPEILGPKDR